MVAANKGMKVVHAQSAEGQRLQRLVQNLHALLTRHYPAPTREFSSALLQLALHHCAAHGVTTEELIGAVREWDLMEHG